MKRFLSVLLCAALTLMLLPTFFQTASAASLTNFNIRLNEPTASYSPDFSLEFNTNATVYSNVTWQENSPGFTAKLNSSDEFRAGLAYKVEIWLLLGDGYYFPVDSYGDLATAITVNGKAISSLKIRDRNDQNQIVEVTVTCEYDPLPGREISSVIVTGIPTPVAGQMPIYSFTVSSSAYGYYHTAPVVWWDMTTGQEMASSDTFIKGHKYQVNIWLQANREGGFTFKVDQNGNPQVSATLNSWAADKVTKAYEQDGREVIDIRYTFPACQAAHSHTPSGWRTNQAYHYKACTTCGEFLTQEDHTGGRATCAEKGKCTVCGYEYLETTEDHIPDTSKWYSRAEMYHFHKCTLCGAHCDIEDHKWSPRYHPVDAKGHAYQCADCKGYDTVKPHNPGPAATETEPQTCKDCNYIIAPAKNHTHSLTKVEEVAPTCTESGVNAYYACSGCSQKFMDAEGKEAYSDEEALTIPPQGHKISNGWGFDSKTHWRTCAECKEKMLETDMAHQLQDGKCTTCEYDENKLPQDTQGTEAPTTEPTEPQPEKKGLSADIPWWLILLIVLGAAGIGVGVTLLLVRKKK